MTIHQLGLEAPGVPMSVDVLSVRGAFSALQPSVETSSGPESVGGSNRRVQFQSNRGRTTATVRFKLRTKNAQKQFSFGIKQFICIDWYSATYKGNKPADGWIWVSYKAPRRWLLDVSTRSMTVQFEPGTDIPTGAKVDAPQAPYYSDATAFVRDGAEVELSIEDGPNGSFPLDMRNAATDRVNYLDGIRIKQSFLTVLTAVRRDGEHIPLEAAYWNHEINGPVEWDTRGEPNVSGIFNRCAGNGSFPSIDRTFAVCDFTLLANRSLTAADCCNQLMNDAMFNVRGQFRRQDFSRPTGAMTRVASNGYEIVQHPMGT